MRWERCLHFKMINENKYGAWGNLQASSKQKLVPNSSLIIFHSEFSIFARKSSIQMVVMLHASFFTKGSRLSQMFFLCTYALRSLVNIDIDWILQTLMSLPFHGQCYASLAAVITCYTITKAELLFPLFLCSLSSTLISSLIRSISVFKSKSKPDVICNSFIIMFQVILYEEIYSLLINLKIGIELLSNLPEQVKELPL